MFMRDDDSKLLIQKVAVIIHLRTLWLQFRWRVDYRKLRVSDPKKDFPHESRRRPSPPRHPCLIWKEAAALIMSSHSLGSKAEVGDAFPNVAVHVGFAGLDPSSAKMSGDLAAKGKTVWVGLPGAFAPT